MRKIYTLLLSLILLPYGMKAETVGAFEVTGGTSGTDYSYSNGVLTVNDGANITISMASGATTPTSDRIVVAENATATITLAGVNIKGSDRDGAQNIAAKSAIDLSNGSILTIALSKDTENTLTGGSGSTDGSGAPGIHVPDSASLIIQGEGNLSVSGGTSGTAYGGVGIGGNAGSGGNAGEACGTVFIFASENVKITAGASAEGNDPADDIGGGKGSQQQNGDDGQGIKPTAEGTYTVYGNLTLPCDITIPQGATVVIPEGASLTVPEGVTLTNKGTIKEDGGTMNGTTSGSGIVQKELTTDMVTVAEGTYTYTGEAHEPTVTIEGYDVNTDYTVDEPTVTIEGYDVNTDYTVEYSNNTNAGEATITVKPTDGGSLFGGDVTKTFTISQATNEWTTEPSIQGWTQPEQRNLEKFHLRMLLKIRKRIAKQHLQRRVIMY